MCTFPTSNFIQLHALMMETVWHVTPRSSHFVLWNKKWPSNFTFFEICRLLFQSKLWTIYFNFGAEKKIIWSICELTNPRKHVCWLACSVNQLIWDCFRVKVLEQKASQERLVLWTIIVCLWFGKGKVGLWSNKEGYGWIERERQK